MPVNSVVITGAFGLVVSVASFGAEASDSFPDASVALAVTFPAGIFFVTVIVATPLSPAVPSPSSLLSLSYNLTVEPGSAVTLTVTGLFVFPLPVNSVVITGAFGLTTTSLLLPEDKLYESSSNSVPVAFFTSFLYVPSTITLALNRSPSDNSLL